MLELSACNWEKKTVVQEHEQIFKPLDSTKNKWAQITPTCKYEVFSYGNFVLLCSISKKVYQILSKIKDIQRFSLD